jgi:hypothetical protein
VFRIRLVQSGLQSYTLSKMRTNKVTASAEKTFWSTRNGPVEKKWVVCSCLHGNGDFELLPVWGSQAGEWRPYFAVIHLNKIVMKIKSHTDRLKKQGYVYMTYFRQFLFIVKILHKFGQIHCPLAGKLLMSYIFLHSKFSN